jgi:hypothetical protein
MKIQKQRNVIDCGESCISASYCTHFTYKNGTCYMKYGNVSQFDAVYTGDHSIVCGYLLSINISY